MMRIRITIVTGMLIGAFIALAAPAQAITVSVVELLEDPEVYAGQEVTVIGELIGDYGFRSDGTMWTQLNGDSYSIRPIVDDGPLRGPNIGIGVRMPTEIGRQLDPPGRYRRLGPVVALTGIWRYHDSGRQGETYLDAVSVVVEAPGRTLSEGPNWPVYGAGFALLAIAVVIGAAYRRERDTLS